MILQQFLWRQRQDSGFLHPEKSRIQFDVGAVTCGERAGTPDIGSGVRMTKEIDFDIKNYNGFNG